MEGLKARGQKFYKKNVISKECKWEKEPRGEKGKTSLRRSRTKVEDTKTIYHEDIQYKPKIRMLILQFSLCKSVAE